MSKGTRWPLKAFQDKKLIEVDGIFVKASLQVAKGKVEKIKLPPDFLFPSKIGILKQDGTIEPLDTNIDFKHTDERAYTGDPKNKFLVDEAGQWETLSAKKVIGNKKVRNAVKSTNAEGVKFDSNLEKHMYGLLKATRIYFNFQVPYVLQEKFAYGTENIRAITLTVDFFLPGKNMIIDTKGWANDRAPLKYKMLKKHLVDTQPDNLPVIELPATKDECNLLLNRLLYQS